MLLIQVLGLHRLELLLHIFVLIFKFLHEFLRLFGKLKIQIFQLLLEILILHLAVLVLALQASYLIFKVPLFLNLLQVYHRLVLEFLFVTEGVGSV